MFKKRERNIKNLMVSKSVLSKVESLVAKTVVWTVDE
jgi:hypothetical protein